MTYGPNIARALSYRLWKRGLLIASSLTILIIGVSVFAACNPAGEQYCNPLGDITKIPDLILKFLDYLLKITIPLAGLGIIIAGLKYVWAAASGNPSQTTTAKNIFTYVLIGSILVVGAIALADAIISFLKNLS